MDAAAVGPSKGEQIIEVVGDPKEFFFAVVRGGDGMEKEVRFRGCADDVAVAVRSVPKNRTCHVRAVAVEVFGVIAARAQAEGGANRSRWREGEDARDVVPEIGVHVRVVDAVVQSGVGHGHDDAASVQTRP